jgi:hypothetical protein
MELSLVTDNESIEINSNSIVGGVFSSQSEIDEIHPVASTSTKKYSCEKVGILVERIMNTMLFVWPELTVLLSIAT